MHQEQRKIPARQSITKEQARVDHSEPLTARHKEKQGAISTKRFQSRIEKSRKKQPKKKQRDCSFCGKPHRIEACKELKKLGVLVPEESVDQTVIDLSNPRSPKFLPVKPMKLGDNIYKQLPPETNFICLHGFATHESLVPEWTSRIPRSEDSYMCVTLVFPLNVQTAINKMCFVPTSKIIRWISKSKTNGKK